MVFVPRSAGKLPADVGGAFRCLIREPARAFFDLTLTSCISFAAASLSLAVAPILEMLKALVQLQ